MGCDFKALARAGVQNVAPYVPGKPIEEVERELGLRHIVKLASNENPMGPSDAVKQAMIASLKDVQRYPDGSGYYLRERLARFHGLAADQFTLGNGSNDILELLAKAFLDGSTSAVYSQYGFLIYDLAIRCADARPIVAPATDYAHDLESVLAAIQPDTRMICLANPNNPTGTYFSAAAFEQFIARVPESVIVVVDEAYVEYVAEPEYRSAMPLIDRYPNVVVTRTFSKAYGLAGLRVGYAVSCPAIADLLNRVRQPFNVNSVALAAAEAALDDQSHLQHALDVNEQGMRDIKACLQELEVDVIPSVANFLTFSVVDAMPLYQALLQHGVIVRPLANYGMHQHLRVSIGTAEENRRFIDVLRPLRAVGIGAA